MGGVLRACGEDGVAERGDYQGSGLALVDDKGRVAIPNALRSTLAANSPRADGKDGGTVIIAWWDDKTERMRKAVGYIGEDGVEAGKKAAEEMLALQVRILAGEPAEGPDAALIRRRLALTGR